WVLSEENIRPNIDDIIGNQSPFYFDKSLFDIYPSIAIGSKIVIIPESKFIFPIEALKYIKDKNINYIYWVPSILKNIANLNLLESLSPKLDKIFFGGESMSAKVLNYWRKYYPNATFGNMYGPSEITDICSRYIVDRNFSNDEVIPIGKACRNTQILLLDDNNELIKSSQITGELYIRGSCLSLQYYKNQSKSNIAFIQNPLHNKYYDIVYKTGDLGYYNEYGEIILVGRADFQIKHNGYRIELGEIENALLDYAYIDDLCVVYDDFDKEIVLYYESSSEVKKAEIFNHLKDKIAKYMFPTKLIKLDSLPLNANGKIDRKALMQSL
ncbi:MAG: AMP-binding protein, partial [Helicobacteraceae bacterium]|nr:AMP-binding protein [Helicobacteraceae bacterium]